ncbi:MAG: MlaD family protein, partial [Mycobacterium sp.]|uniref:MlaD family protein n=1 Tax=Mycobacterium sp. TaxID=1785 RepID=UPI003BAF9322
MQHSGMRALTGLATVAVIAMIVVVAVSLFRGSWPFTHSRWPFADNVPVTVTSSRAGLVMNPDAKVEMRGVQVGKVDSIESRPNGQAVLH